MQTSHSKSNVSESVLDIITALQNIVSGQFLESELVSAENNDHPFQLARSRVTVRLVFGLFR